MRRPTWPQIVLCLILVAAVPLLVAVGFVRRVEAAPIPALSVEAQTQGDEAATLALEEWVNDIRLSYGKPERAPSSKLRRIAGTWKVIYTANAAAIEPTTLYGLVYDTVRDATFATTEIYYSAFDMAGEWSPEQIAAYWQAGPVNWYIYQTPLHQQQGCGYRFKPGQNGQPGKTQAFCLYGTEWDVSPTATPSPMPLSRPPMPTPRPLSTPTPLWRR